MVDPKHLGLFRAEVYVLYISFFLSSLMCFHFRGYLVMTNIDRFVGDPSTALVSLDRSHFPLSPGARGFTRQCSFHEGVSRTPTNFREQFWESHLVWFFII